MYKERLGVPIVPSRGYKYVITCMYLYTYGERERDIYIYTLYMYRISLKYV